MKITGTLGPKTNTINVQAIRLPAETSQPIEIASPQHWHLCFSSAIVSIPLWRVPIRFNGRPLSDQTGENACRTGQSPVAPVDKTQFPR